MKTSILLLLLCSASFFAQAQQQDRYTQLMTQTVAVLDTARSSETFVQASNTFERIAMNAPKEWLPTYYKAYCQMMLATGEMQAGRIEACTAHLDAAQDALNAASALAPKESEVVALQGYIYQGRIWENPMTKGAEFSPKVQQTLEMAMSLNPQNPRPYYLLGQQLLFTPEFYGGGGKAALPWLEKAEALFGAEAPASAMHPRWGKYANAYMMGLARK